MTQLIPIFIATAFGFATLDFLVSVHAIYKADGFYESNKIMAKLFKIHPWLPYTITRIVIAGMFTSLYLTDQIWIGLIFVNVAFAYMFVKNYFKIWG